MTNGLWPLFDLRVTTPRMELRGVDDEMAHELASLAARGVHDSSTMPFSVPWTQQPSPLLEQGLLRYHWRNRVELSVDAWTVTLVALVDGAVVGTIDIRTQSFPVLRQFETGSWLGREHQGRGLGKEMRLAALHLGFDGFGAHWATTGAFEDNAASLGVTRSLGYATTGHRRVDSLGSPRTMIGFELHRDDFAARLRRSDVVLHGVDACRPLLGIETGD